MTNPDYFLTHHQVVSTVTVFSFARQMPHIYHTKQKKTDERIMLVVFSFFE